MISLVLATPILVLLLQPSQAVSITIRTSGNPRCSDDETLSNCTLDAGLIAAQQFTDPVTITISPGNYTLQNNISCVYHNRSDIQIVGQGSPVVNCLPGTGCSFYDCQGITIKDVTFIGCGAIHNSTSRNFTAKTYSLLMYRVAIYFEFCFDVAIVGANICHSNGMGLVFMGSEGYISIADSYFANNAVAKGMVGGGGVYIEFPKCKPGDVACGNGTNTYTMASTVRHSYYNFTNCRFVNNDGSDGEFKKTHIIKSQTQSDHYAFGSGGGLLVYFKGYASNKIISIDSCEFMFNQAEVGAGSYISFSDASRNNFVHVTDTNFTDNVCHVASILPDNFISGGGTKVHFGKHSQENTFIVHGSSFVNNSANWGGGLSVHAKGKSPGNSRTNHIMVIGCHFESNIATIGAAIDFLSQLSSSTLQDSSLIPVVANSTFTRNGGVYKYTNGIEGVTFGTVNLESMPITFKGNTLFDENLGSALVIQSSDVLFANESTSTFIANKGRIGAAITMLGASWIGVNAGTRLVFDGNTAVEKGGAVYSEQAKEHYEAYSHTCFIRYSDPHLPPSEWKSFFTFANNTASSKPNSIFASSILPCVWAANIHSTLEDDISQTFCSWKNWEFGDTNCSDEILTSGAKFNSSAEGYAMTVYPGLKTKLNVTILDELGHNVTNQTIFSITIDTNHNDANATFQYTSDNCITIYGIKTSTTAIRLETIDNRNVYAHINVTLSTCPTGLVFNSSTNTCTCNTLSFATFVYCEGSTALIFVGYCISYSPLKQLGGGNGTILTRCPFGIEKNTVKPYMVLPKNVSDLDKDYCRRFHRTGKLCGQCVEGYGISLTSGTFKCTKCDNFSKDLWEFFVISFLLPTVFFLLVIIFHIGVTSAPANGFIFFSQVITVPLQVLLIDSAWKLILQGKDLHDSLTNLLLHPYRLWSLDFSSLSDTDVCLNPHLKVIDVLAIRYVSAVYPVIVLIITYAVIELRARNCRLMVCLWKPCCFLCVKLRRKWQPRNSIINAFATFILLSYTKFIRVSITILTPSNVYNINGSVVERTVNYDPITEYFSHDHFPYAALAVIILATFGAIPPLLLLLYPFRWFQRCLTRCKLQSHALRAFVDAFQGCYKDGKNGGPDRRYFAGIYFSFRIAIFAIYTVENSFNAIFTLLQAAYVVFMLAVIILRPYKKEFYNVLDASFFAILAVTSGTTMYMYTALVETQVLPRKVFYLTYCLYLIPFIYMVTYVIYRLLMQSRWFQTHCIDKVKQYFQRRIEEDTISNEPSSDEEESDHTHTTSELPDRLDNPERYENNGDAFERSLPGWASEQVALRKTINWQANYGTAVTY